MTNTILNRRGVPAGLFVSDPRTAEALAAKLAENGIDVVQQTHGAFVWANIIQNTNFAQLKTVVIELPASGDLIEAVKALAKHLDAGTSLILLGRESSVVFYHQLKRAGATDYYPLTTAPEEIAYGVKASLEPQQEQEAPVGGRVIAVFGAGYGIGAGTTATVLAAELAQTDPVIVVDAGLLMPSVGSYLGVDVPGSLPKMLQAQDRLDAVLVNQSLVETRKGLKLLDGYEPFGSGQRVTDALCQKSGGAGGLHFAGCSQYFYLHAVCTDHQHLACRCEARRQGMVDLQSSQRLRYRQNRRSS